MMNTKKKIKKQPKYSPVFINLTNDETLSTLILRIVIKASLVCLSAMGLCVALSQVYRIPVSTSSVMLVCFTSVALFNVALMLFKKRALLIPLILFLIFNRAENIVHDIVMFFNHILYVLDSRLLATADYAIYSWQEVTLPDNSRSVALVFLVFCILISLIFTLGARSRYIGVMLVTTVFTFTPAFGAEIAGYVTGIDMLLAGMLGIYSMWVAHAWENFGGVLRLNTPNDNKWHQSQEQAQVQNSEKDKKAQNDSKGSEIKDPIYKLTPGRLPYYYKYSRNSIIAAVIAICASFIAVTAVPNAVKFNHNAILDSIKQVGEGISSPFRKLFGQSDSGYFPNISSGTDISSGITLDNPSTSSTPIIRVSLEDDTEKIYLRGGIGIDFTGDEWTIQQDTYEYNRLLEILQEFSPEIEYQSFMRSVESSSGGMLNPDDIIGWQNVKIDYLMRTGFLLLPTQPSDTAFRTNPDYTWYLDYYLRPNKRVKSTTFETLYPKLSKYNNFSDAYRSAIMYGYDYSTEWGYEHKQYYYQNEYHDLIRAIYTHVPESEADNIGRLLSKITITGLESYSGYSSYWHEGALPGKDVFPTDSEYSHYPIEYADILTASKAVHDYLRANYSYSLETDNTAGAHTILGNFLHETEEGHCAMYASAMTLAMRQLGYPARYVTGVVTVANGGKIQEMAERDFHAWTEVYFEGLGWIPFDPTGGAHGRENSNNSAVEYVPSTSQTNQQTEEAVFPTVTEPASESETTAPENTEPVKSVNKGDDDNFGANFAIIMVVLIPLVLAGCGVFLLRSVKKAETVKLARLKSTGDNKTAEEMYRFMFRLLKCEGFEALSGETPLQFGKRVDGEFTLEAKLSDIMPVFEKLEFGDVDLTGDEYDKLYEYVDALYRAVVSEKKAVKRVVRRFRALKI